MFSTKLFTKNLNTKNFGRKLHYKKITDSTNDDAWKHIKTTAFNEGEIFLANYQHSGRGRQNRKWVSTCDSHLSFSIILIPKIENYKLGLLSLLAGVSVCEALFDYTGINFSLKWPNDIMYKNKKIGGILIEQKMIESNIILVMGIGLNINESINDFPLDIIKKTSSLKLITKKEYSKEKTLSSILFFLEKNYDKEISIVSKKWLQYCNHLNKKINIILNNKNISAHFIGINNLGNAIININGNDKIISYGEIF